MKANHTTITEKASAHVFKQFSGKLGETYTYHNFTHTAEVVEAVVEIGEASGLSEEDLEDVVLAAWFHDVGIVESYEQHEQKSIEMAERFLKKHDFEKDRIGQVSQCIRVTQIDVAPTTLKEKVICDGDLLHIGTKSFWAKSDLLRQEWEAVNGRRYSDLEWVKLQITFLSKRQFYTDHVKATYQKRLDKNMAKLEKTLAAMENGESLDEAMGKKKDKKNKGDRKSAEDFLGRGDRGVETMFRITARNHVSFSGMVDSKANIMISINALVISVIISVLFRKLDTNPYMAVPTFIFLGVCLMTIVYAVLASRPKVTEGVFTREDITNKKANLLFFGNFYNVPVDDFEWGMREMLKDKDYLYGSMIRDFYYLGQVLGKKYRHLRISYNIFMYGFVFSILLYVVMFLVFADAPVDLIPLQP